ncbi:MAG: hypothetical protein C0405_06535 [Desulfovibrio sp.]|nr:hypothetical protein [Desulfovibrio sp.]
MSLGAAGEPPAAGRDHTKPGAGGHPQPYDEHGRYAGTGTLDAANSPVRTATGARAAPPQSPLGRGPQQGEKVGKHYVLTPEVKAGNARTVLVYRQSDGSLMDMEDRLVGQGYSGAPGYVNKPDGQDKKDLGVIPEGTYIIGDVIVKREDARGMGPNCIKLNPDPATAERIRAMSRDPDTFYIHGDNGRGDQSASQGCIIMEWPERKALRELQGAKIRVLR